jgi:hypothetical protein
MKEMLKMLLKNGERDFYLFNIIYCSIWLKYSLNICKIRFISPDSNIQVFRKLAAVFSTPTN